jgi:hypothetical protein
MNQFIVPVILNLRARRGTICPDFNGAQQTGKRRFEEVLRFQKLGSCSDPVTKSTKFWNSAGENHFGIAFSRKLLISCVRYAEYLQSAPGNFRSIGILEAFFDVAASSIDEEEFLPMDLSDPFTPICHLLNILSF